MGYPEPVAGTLTPAERLLVERHEVREGLCCHLFPPAPDVEYTCPRCETVYRTRQVDGGPWEWVIHDEPDGCKHRTVLRYPPDVDDPDQWRETVDCNDQCDRRFAEHGEWFPDVRSRLRVL